jgi:hypothetical protein
MYAFGSIGKWLMETQMKYKPKQSFESWLFQESSQYTNTNLSKINIFHTLLSNIAVAWNRH